MIIGAHALLYSRRPEETRDLLRKILRGRRVDAGGGWLIMALPAAEIAVHPAEGRQFHEIYLMCDDMDATLAELAEKGVELCSPVQQAPWGDLTYVALPGGGRLGLYQPRHPTALGGAAGRPRRAGRPGGKRKPARPATRRKPARPAARQRKPRARRSGS